MLESFRITFCLVPGISGFILHVSSASFAYPHADGSVRAELARSLRTGTRSRDVFVLDTCLRMEVLVAGDLDRLDEAVGELFGVHAQLGHARVRVGEAAVDHIFRVAAGLESPILGEREILTQFRQAVLAAEEQGSITGLMVKLLETAVSVGRQARELLPASPHDSMAVVAAQVVGNRDRVAVLGSGLMATAVVGSLLALPAPPKVTVVARSPEKVSIDDVDVVPFERAVEVLSGFPAVVSATSAKKRLISDDALTAVLSERTDPLDLVDMAMPPDFTPPVGAPVRYVDIDDLARMADRKPRRDDADAMVMAAAADAYRRVSDHHAVGPVIGGLMQAADEIVERTVERFAGRLGQGDDRAVLRQTAHTVARTLLASPVGYLRSSDRPSEAVDTIAEAFGLDDD